MSSDVIHAVIAVNTAQQNHRAEELIKLTRKAAGLALSGKRFSTEDRVDAAAEILLAGLTDHSRRNGLTTGMDRAYNSAALPSADDPAHGFTAYYRRAQRVRERIDADTAATASEEEVENAPELGALDKAGTLMGGVEELVRGGSSPAEARASALAASEALGTSSMYVYAVLYAHARYPAREKTLAAELKMTPSTYRQHRSRGRAILREHYPTARDLLEALTGGRVTISPVDGSYRFTLSDRMDVPAEVKRPGTYGRSLMLGLPTREARERPQAHARAISAEEARHYCGGSRWDASIAQEHAQKAREGEQNEAQKAAKSLDERRADALTRLSWALA